MKHVVTVLVVLAAGIGAARAEPAAATTAAQVLARARAAQGGAAWDAVTVLKATGEISTGGLKGRFDTLEDVRTGAYADRFDLGAIRGANGYDGRTAWSVDASGQPRVEGSEEMTTAAASEAYRRSRAFWFADRWPADVTLSGERSDNGRRFEVLTIRPRDGRPFDLWVDDATGLPDRVVQQVGPDLQTTFYSDYREVPGAIRGLKIAYLTRSTNGVEKYDTVAQTGAVEVNPAVEAAVFAMPAPPRTDSGFEGAMRSATVPFEQLNGHVYLQVKLNGQGPFRLAFDSGGMNVVTPQVTRALGLTATGALEGRGTGEGSEDIGVAKMRRVSVGPAYLADQTFFVMSLEELNRVGGVRMDGLIGYEVFRRFIVRVDYERGEVTLCDPATWKYAGNATPVPFVFNEHKPQVDGAIDGIPGRFDIDTGSRGSVDLFGPFVEKNGLIARYRPSAERITGWGVGGASRGQIARAGELRLGPVTVRSPVVGLATATRGSFGSDFVAGNVGAGVLQRFNVTFDYPQQVIYFEPNRRFDDPDAYDRAGLWVNVDAESGKPAFEVVEVVPGGPAEEAGIRAGDRIVGIDGRGPGEIGLPAFRAMLREKIPGTRVQLRISAPGGDRTAVLVLRDLV